AERRLCVGHRHVDHEIGPAPFEEPRGRHARDHDEISCRTAVQTELALALELDARPILDAGRNLHREALRATLTAGAVTFRARPLDHGSVAAASRTRLRQGKEALRLPDDTTAVTLRTDHRRGSRLPAR